MFLITAPESLWYVVYDPVICFLCFFKNVSNIEVGTHPITVLCFIIPLHNFTYILDFSKYQCIISFRRCAFILYFVVSKLKYNEPSL